MELELLLVMLYVTQDQILQEAVLTIELSFQPQNTSFKRLSVQSLVSAQHMGYKIPVSFSSPQAKVIRLTLNNVI